MNDIICGDALEVLPMLPEAYFGGIVTDPPYGMAKDFGNESDSINNAVSLVKSVMPELFRVLRVGGMAFVFGSPRLIHKTINAGEAAGFVFQRILWMYKPNDCTFPWRGWLLTSEAIAVFSRGQPDRWQGEQYCHDCYHFNHSGGELPGSEQHPSVKPLDIVRDIVRKCPDGPILDCFVGSGTTLIAARQEGREFVGIEIEEDYCTLAEKRLARMQHILEL